ncbi:glycosyltransferase family 2 protein [Pseudooceanicola sp. LIPI14-2-Ac024]|uniref:glycosyltransferase family 2 protein n=1 Tax=Pseudooceanicola sp. LIPI14-2-Ac024 TaxID=3344875 RepID=UPI0035CF624D
MIIQLHIGMDAGHAARLQSVLADKRKQLAGKGVLFPRSPGTLNHTRLFMAVTGPVDSLRHNRGFATPDRQAALAREVTAALRAEVEAAEPEVLILSAAQLGPGLAERAELDRLRAMLAPLSGDIRIVAHLRDQAHAFAAHYAGQVIDGRATGPEVELALRDAPDWWAAALAAAPRPDAARAVYFDVQAPAFWLDYEALANHWKQAFDSVTLRPVRANHYGPGAVEELRGAFGITVPFGKARAGNAPAAPAAAWLARARQMNALILRLLSDGERIAPRSAWRAMLEDLRIPGPPVDAGAFTPLAERFAAGNARLLAAHPALTPADLAPPDATAWAEADPQHGFRATAYLAANRWRIDRATAAAHKAAARAAAARNALPRPEAQAVMSPLAVQKFRQLVQSPFRPHNDLGAVAEADAAPPYAAVSHPGPPRGSTGNVIVACMKDEGPYILEWIAHHRAIGIDSFVVYTNGCSDGTDAILRRLDALGIVHHRDNDGWTGKSPQQCALDAAVDDPVLRDAAWIAHIDVDEFINIRCGNGTLQDVFDRAPEATNIAMTWRLFGHNGVERFEDRFVIDQFDACAPSFCPKPHTAWGFKTLFRNIGAYEKLSCHRPNRPDPDRLDEIRWVNGSGRPMGPAVVRSGWRNSKRSIGYDLVQLNHYALRSADSYLIKRQRGRALHVDRTIGLNYWIRMDWCDFKDLTIKRHLPRMAAEVARLKEDADLARLHAEAGAWHRRKAVELRATPEFAALLEQALNIRLTATERTAYALALDTES